MPNYMEYQQSISNELITIKNRVRNLLMMPREQIELICGCLPFVW